MLNELSVKHGMVISELATSQDITLGALPASPVGQIAATIATLDSETFGQDPEKQLLGASRTGQLTMSDHGETAGSLSDQLASLVERSSLILIRNEILPICREIRDGIQLERMAIADANSAEVRIKMVEISPIYSSTLVMDSLTRNNRPVGMLTIRQSLRDTLKSGLTNEDLLAMLKTSNDSVNAEIAKMVAEPSMSEVLDNSVVGMLINSDHSNFRGEHAYVNHIPLLSLLFLKATHAGKHPCIKPSSLENADRLELSRAINVWEEEVRKQVTIQDRRKSRKDAFISYHVESRILYVDTKLYMEWIDKEENTLEVVHGICNAHPTSASMRLNDNIDYTAAKRDYKRAVNKAESIKTTLSDTAIENLVRRKLNKHFRKEAELSSIAEEELKENLVKVAEVMKNHRKYATVDDKTFVIQAVCRVFDEGLETELVLVEADRYLNSPDNEGATMQDALAIAHARLIGRYLATQIVASRGGENFDAPIYLTS